MAGTERTLVTVSPARKNFLKIIVLNCKSKRDFLNLVPLLPNNRIARAKVISNSDWS